MGEADNQSKVRPMRGAKQDGLDSNLNFSMNEGNSKNNRLSTDFEAIIKELDKDIFEGQPISNPIVVEIIHEINGSNSKTDGNLAVLENIERSVGYSDALKSQDLKNHDSGETNPSFSMGWAENKVGIKSTKLGKRKNLKGVASEGKAVDGLNLIKEQKWGMWTRLTNRPNMEVMSTNCWGVEGLKCKHG